MSGPAAKLWIAIRRSLPARCLFLVAVVSLAYLAVAPVAYRLHGTSGLLAEAVGAGVCLAGVLLSLLIAARHQGTEFALNGLLLGMFFRMGLPLTAALVIKLRSQTPLPDETLVYLLVFFLVALAAHAVVSLPTPNNNDD